MHLMLIMEMTVIMKVMMKVVKMKRSHFVGSKNIGAAHEKNNQDNLEQAYIALWEDKIVKVYIRLLFGWIKRQLLWI